LRNDADIPEIRTPRHRLLLLGTALLMAASCSLMPAPAPARVRVLRVGNLHGKKGQFDTIQGAVDAAKPHDWILVGPGDYHERGDRVHPPGPGGEDPPPSGVLVTKPRLHIRGMSRNSVIVDGTLPGKGGACSRKAGRQDFGVKSGGGPLGRNGIVAFKANGVTVQNLTVCNFLSGSGNSGNEIWWNGGDGSGTIGMGSFKGTYLNATSTFYKDESTAAAYGLFSSNSRGPGLWKQTYASNFNDSDYYIGACRQVCNQVMDHAWAQYSVLGYSGTNAGGKLVVKNSEFDHNRDGFDTNSQNNDDAPSPQDGSCPNGGLGPITHTNSCWVFINNYVHDNNNANVPSSGSAGAAPVGTGMTISGGRFDTIIHNRIVHNGSWGVLFVPYPDTGTPPPIAHCEGGTDVGPPFGCLYDDWGSTLANNNFSNNGFFGNDTNSDFGQITFFDGNPINCFYGNHAPDGSSPPDLQQTNSTCGTTGVANLNTPLLNQVVCNTGLLGGACPPGSSYPRVKKIVMHPLPKKKLPTMAHPCGGVPANPWCPRHRH
jgi:hypothetical protein